MRPIKPKKMSKALNRAMTDALATAEPQLVLYRHEVRSILAALEYERQRADRAEATLADIRDHGGPLRGDWARTKAMVTVGKAQSASHQCEQTAAVVPSKGAGRAVKHARPDAYDVHRERAKRRG